MYERARYASVKKLLSCLIERKKKRSKASRGSDGRIIDLVIQIMLLEA